MSFTIPFNYRFGPEPVAAEYLAGLDFENIVERYEWAMVKQKSTGRIYLMWFPDTVTHYPTKLVRYREPFFSELCANHLLRRYGVSMNEWFVDKSETIDLTLDLPPIP